MSTSNSTSNTPLQDNDVIINKKMEKICDFRNCVLTPSYEFEPFVQTTTERTIYDRFGVELNLTSAQYDLINIFSNPMSLKRVSVKIHSTDNIFPDVTSVHDFPNIFPRNVLLNLPTGFGKTIVSTISSLNVVGSPDFRTKCQQSYENRILPLIDQNGRGKGAVFPSGYTYLHNTIFVHCPNQLIGMWRDVFTNNTRGNGNVKILPKLGEYQMSSIDIDEIRTNPDNIYIFILQDANYKRFLRTKDGIEIVHGVAIVDEFHSKNVSTGRNKYTPIAMYNILVSATISDIANRVKMGGTVLENLLQPFDDLCKKRLKLLADKSTTRNLGNVDLIKLFTHQSNRDFVRHISRLYSLTCIPDELCTKIHQQLRTPPVYSMRIRSQQSYLRRAGIIDNDLLNPERVNELIEKHIDMKINGKTKEEVMASVQERINKIISNKTPARNLITGAVIPCARFVDCGLLGRLQNFLKFLGEKYNDPCVICMDDRIDNQSVLFTECCSTCICETCMKQLMTSKNKTCPSCRNQNIHFTQVTNCNDNDIDNHHHDHEDHASNNANHVNDDNIEYENIERGPLTMDGFKMYINNFPSGEYDQITCIRKILTEASLYPVKRVIIAGADVNNWTFIKDKHEFVGYQLLNSRETRLTAKHLDHVYTTFDQGDDKHLLVLDTEHLKGQQVTGIDLRTVDLIIEIGSSITKQLIGRGSRLSSVNPSVLYININ